MKLYLASTLSNAPRIKQIREQLSALGHQITYAWDDHGFISDPELLLSVAVKESQGVWDADALVFITPVAEGSCIEFGIAVGKALSGRPMPIYMVQEQPIAPARWKTFYQLPQVIRCAGVNDLINNLARNGGGHDRAAEPPRS